MSLTKQIEELKAGMRQEQIDPEKGLGEELFLFASSLIPIINVDLLIFNEKGQVLLSWRDDKHSGKGWHVPGGCLRFKETFLERVHKTAISELGVDVAVNPEPLKIFEIFTPDYREGLTDQRERAHAVTLVYECSLDNKVVTAQNEISAGILKWFDDLPDDFLEVQHCYKEHWMELKSRRGQ